MIEEEVDISCSNNGEMGVGRVNGGEAFEIGEVPFEYQSIQESRWIGPCKCPWPDTLINLTIFGQHFFNLLWPLHCPGFLRAKQIIQAKILLCIMLKLQAGN